MGGAGVAPAENFCLRWNDFESNVSGAFRELRAESDLFDISLCCDGAQGSVLRAHKVILSACSAFFKQMLRTTNAATPSAQPMIYLRGVKLQELESVLDFMYHGEVNVAQHDLNAFLAVAEDLQIKGLTQTQPSTGKRSSCSSPSTSASSSKRSRTEELPPSATVKREPEASAPGGSGMAVPSLATAQEDEVEGDYDYGEDDGCQALEEGQYLEEYPEDEPGGNETAPPGAKDSTKGKKELA